MNTRTNHGAIVPIERVEQRLGWQDFKDPVFPAEASAYRIKPDEIPWIEWHGGPCPLKDEEVKEWEFLLREGFTWKNSSPPSKYNINWRHQTGLEDIVAYRVLKWREKKPKVPLGPEDVPPGSVVRGPADGTEVWAAVITVVSRGISITDGRCISYKPLKEDGWIINRSIPLTGKWNPTAWEPCEK